MSNRLPMNGAHSKEMTTQAWQPQSVQSSVPGQSTMGGTPGQWQSSPAPTQSPGVHPALYPASSSLPPPPPPPPNSVPAFRAPHGATPDAPRPQPSTPPAAASLPQGNSIPASTNVVSQGYVPNTVSYTGPRWPPPSGPISQVGLPAPVSQIQTLAPNSQPGLPPPPRLGPSGLPPPPTTPWCPSPSRPPAVSALSVPSSIPAPQEVSGDKVPPVSHSAPDTPTPVACTQAGPSGLASLSVSQLPCSLSSQPSSQGTPGPSVNTSAPGSDAVAPVPSVPPALSESSVPSLPPRVAGVPPVGVPGAPSLHGPLAITAITSAAGVSPFPHPSSAPFGPRASTDASILGTKLPTSTSAGPAATVVLGAGQLQIAQQPPYVPYISVPPVPAPLPWSFQPLLAGQLQPRPLIPPFVPNPYLPPIRPAVPIQTGLPVTTTKLPSDNVAPLAPPGEQVPAAKVTNMEGDTSLSTSVRAVNGHATASTISVTSTTSSMVIDFVSRNEPVVEATDVWTAHKTSEGIVYYYNSVTGQSTYEKPLGFQGEVDKVTAQPTPISWEMIGGTGWAMVTTNDGKKYYYHKETQAASWQVPLEVVEYRTKQLEEAKLGTGGQPVKAGTEKGTISFTLNFPGAGNSAPKSVASAPSSSALDLIKKKLQDSASPGLESGATDGNPGRGLAGEGIRDKAKDNHAEKSSSDFSSDSDEERGPSKEECVAQFKEMLIEKGIAPFSKWEKELPKIIFDPRCKAIPSHTERRSIFEHYVRTRAEEERKEKRAAQKAAIEGFKQLLEEGSKDITHNTDYEKFAKIWVTDPRFQALERKDRETLLNERVLPLRKAQEERVRAIQAAAVTGFKAMLTELGEVNTLSRWSRIKDKLRNDPRYRAVKREEREALFNAFVAELRAAEQEAEKAAKAKREEEKLKERDREVRKRKERDEQEWEKIRAKARKKTATTAYQALLMEKIKDPEASWTESRPKLEKDPLNRATNADLDGAEMEKLFREHVNTLYDRAVRDYRALLAEAMSTDAASKGNEEGKSMLNSWSEAKRLLKSDPRYNKTPRREREPWWRRYAEDMQQKKAGSKERPPVPGSSGGGSSGKAASPDGSRRAQSRR